MSASFFKLIVALSLCMVSENRPSPVVDPPRVRVGDRFSLSCDITRVSAPVSLVKSIDNLGLYRQSAPDNTAEIVGQYFTVVPPNIGLTSPVHPKTGGSVWNFTFVGGNKGLDNVKTMKLTVNVQNVQCHDAAFFYCQVNCWKEVGNPHQTIKSSPEKLTVEVSSIEVSLESTPSPAKPASKDSSHLQYENGTTVKFTCTVVGRKSVNLVWQKFVQRAGIKDFIEIPVVNTPTNQPPVLQPDAGGCESYSHGSTLTIVVKLPEVAVFKCSVREDQTELASKNITLGEEEGDTSLSTVPPTGSSAEECNSNAVLVLVTVTTIINFLTFSTEAFDNK